MAKDPYLSFNQALGSGNFGIPEDDDDSVVAALKEPMKLKDVWYLWEQVVMEGGSKNWADATRRVCKFTTVQDFWSIWNAVPQPSELLEQKRIMKEQPNGQSVPIDAIMIFKEGIPPEWDAPGNAAGGMLRVQLKPSVGGGQIDEYWNNVVLGMVGGTLLPPEISDIITGVRLVDKLAGNKVGSAIRIELWFSAWSDSTNTTIRKNFERCMCTKLDGSLGSGQPKSELKKHHQ